MSLCFLFLAVMIWKYGRDERVKPDRKVQHPAAELPYKSEDLTWLYSNGVKPEDIELAAKLRDGIK